MLNHIDPFFALLAVFFVFFFFFFFFVFFGFVILGMMAMAGPIKELPVHQKQQTKHKYICCLLFVICYVICYIQKNKCIPVSKS